MFIKIRNYIYFFFEYLNKTFFILVLICCGLFFCSLSISFTGKIYKNSTTLFCALQNNIMVLVRYTKSRSLLEVVNQKHFNSTWKKTSPLVQNSKQRSYLYSLKSRKPKILSLTRRNNFFTMK